MDNENPYRIHVLECSLGQSASLLARSVNNIYNPNVITIERPLRSKKIFVDGNFILFQIWNVRGVGAKLGRSYYLNGYHGVIIIFDVTDENSYGYVEFYIKDISENTECDLDVILVGNLSGNNRVISKEMSEKMALENNMHYFDISIAENRGIDEAFSYLATKIHHNHIYKNNKANFQVLKK